MRRRDVHPRRLVTFSSSLPFGQSTKLWGVALLVFFSYLNAVFIRRVYTPSKMCVPRQHESCGRARVG